MFTNVVELQVPNGWEAQVTDGLLLLLGLDDGLHGVWLESGTYIGNRSIDFAGITRSSADADNALDANEAGIRVIRGVPNFRKSIT